MNEVKHGVGEVFAERYELLELLGSGGIGTVYKARQIDADRLLALKILHEFVACDEEFKERFLREARALSRLVHKHIVTVYHMGLSEEGTPFLAMELLDGRPLRDLIADGPLAFSRAIEIAKQICSALKIVHNEGVVHRDLKPENIMLLCRSDDFVKVIDFGLARLETQQGEQKLTGTGMLLGSVSYMSPEQCLGRVVDARADLYALCLCLYEMISGRHPFKADTPVGMMYEQVNTPPAKLSVERGLPSRLDDFMQKGLAKDVSLRFQNADELYSELSLLQDESLEPADSGILGRPYVLPVLMCCLILAALLFALGMGAKVKQQAEPPKATLVDNDWQDTGNDAAAIQKLLARKDLSSSYKLPILGKYVSAHHDRPEDLAIAEEAYKIAKTPDLSYRGEKTIRKLEYYLAHLYWACGNSKKSSEFCQTLLSLPVERQLNSISPEEVQNLKGFLATDFYNLGNLKEARRLVEEIALIPNNGGDSEAVRVAILLKDEKLVRKIVDNETGQWHLANLSRFFRQSRRMDLSERSLNRAENLPMDEQEEIEYTVERAKFCIQTGKIEQARKSMASLFKSGKLPDYLVRKRKISISYDIAATLLASGLQKEALDIALPAKRSDNKMQLLKAHLLALAGRYDEAARELKPGMQIMDPNSGQMVDALERLNQIRSKKTVASGGLLNYVDLDS